MGPTPPRLVLGGGDTWKAYEDNREAERGEKEGRGREEKVEGKAE